MQCALGETQSQFAMRQHILVSNRSNRDEILYPGTPNFIGYKSSAVGSSQSRNNDKAQEYAPNLLYIFLVVTTAIGTIDVI